jgi:hypothetical protein
VSKFDLVVSAVGLSNADLSGIDFSHTIVTEEQWKNVFDHLRGYHLPYF